MGEIVLLPKRPRQVGAVRSRNEALEILVPKILGILWEKGRPDRQGLVTATIDEDIELGGYVLGRGRYGLHAYSPSETIAWKKAVFGISR
jgi:hypothetical protein